MTFAVRSSSPLFPLRASRHVSPRFSRFATVLMALMPMTGFAANTKTLEYAKGDETFEGLVSTPSKPSKAVLPGVLLVHNWMGISDETRRQAERIADLGYVVFSVDVYGKGVRPSNAKQAGELAGRYKGDRAAFRERLATGLAELRKQGGVDAKSVFAVGYCFGGTGVLELARKGADVKGVVSLHGGLDSPASADGANIKARVLALHGADDPYVTPEELAAFEKEMATNKVDWQLVKFGNTVHSFTEKAAGDDNAKGAAYNALSDKRSFEMMRDFFISTLAMK